MTGEELWTVEVHSGESPSITVKYESCGWRADYQAQGVRGHPAITSVQLAPVSDESAPLSGALARALVRPGVALGLVRRALAEDSPRFLAGHGIETVAERRGKRQDDFLYAAIAAHYVQIVGQSDQAVKDTASVLGYEGYYVRDALARARDRELLTRPDSKRRAGGELTPLGQEVLDAGPPEGYVGPVSP